MDSVCNYKHDLVFEASDNILLFLVYTKKPHHHGGAIRVGFNSPLSFRIGLSVIYLFDKTLLA